jgi:hypothetical protein
METITLSSSWRAIEEISAAMRDAGVEVPGFGVDELLTVRDE